MQGLDDIEKKASSDAYASQTDYDTELQDLVASANNEHLYIVPCTANVFNFFVNTSLVSIASSTDSQPQVFQSSDIIGNVEAPSPIVTINGEDVVDFLKKSSSLLTSQGADARYNMLFKSWAVRSANQLKLLGQFAYDNGRWPGSHGSATFDVTYANNGSTTWSTWAKVNGNLAEQAKWTLQTGQQIYDQYCLPQAQVSPPAPTETSLEPPTPPLEPDPQVEPTETSTPQLDSRQTTNDGPPLPPEQIERYPLPLARDKYNIFTGYYLDDPHGDTAVFFLPMFEVRIDPITRQKLPEDYLQNELAPAVYKFIQQAKADGKTKIILDLTQNPGGDVASGVSLFKLFFPQTNVVLATRQRSSNFLRLVAEASSAVGEDFPDPASLSVIRDFGWQYLVLPDQSPNGWSSYLDFVGPEGTELTSAIASLNFSRAFSGAGIPGYGNAPEAFSEPPFAPDNILIMTDSLCASTCSNFVYYMTVLGNVSNTIVWGGLPSSGSDAILPELVGGVRGPQVLTFAEIAEDASYAVQYIANRTAAGKPTLDEAKQNQLKDVVPKPLSEFPLRIAAGGVNTRNGYRPDSEVPLQFDRQPAGCRLYYTAETFLEPAKQWYAAADAAWKSEKGCKMPAPAEQAKAQNGLGPMNYTQPSGTSSDTSSSSTSSSADSTGSNDAAPMMSAGSMLVGVLVLLFVVMLV